MLWFSPEGVDIGNMSAFNSLCCKPFVVMTDILAEIRRDYLNSKINWVWGSSEYAYNLFSNDLNLANDRKGFVSINYTFSF